MVREATFRLLLPRYDGIAFAVSPDGKSAVTGNPQIRWWHTLDGRPFLDGERHENWIKKLAFDRGEGAHPG